jgi:cytoskeletal protein CcmA (bactofilin family)
MIGGRKQEAPTPEVTRSDMSDAKYTLGKGSEFEGKLKFEGTVIIDGKFKGEIRSTGTLVIGAKALVEAEIEVGSCVIIGKFKGNIVAKSKLEMQKPAVVKGNIASPILMIQEGVSFDGNCQTSGGAQQGSRSGAKAQKGVPGNPAAKPEQPELIN